MPVRYRVTSNTEFNIKSFLEKKFLDEGLYITISSGLFDVSGDRADVLKRINGNLYESLFDEWAFETDAVAASGFPIIFASGVTIDGVFHASNSLPHKPAINFRQGNVRFLGTSISATSTVTAEFTYKHVRVDFPESDAINVLLTQAKDATEFTQFSHPSGVQRSLPRVVVDIQEFDPVPWAIGGDKRYPLLVVLHVLANTRHESKQIVDILTEDSFHQVIRGVDFNKIPEVFTDFGDYGTGYRTFTDLGSDPATQWFKIYIDRTRLREQMQMFGFIERARVDWNVNIFRRSVI